MESRELVIIGGGPAGLTSAIYGRRAGLDLVLLEKGSHGGQIISTSEIENWPGTRESTGTDLAKSFYEHAAGLGTEFRKGAVREIVSENGHHLVRTSNGDIAARTVIIATGASFRRLGCKGEAELIGAGVSFCAVCDGAFYQDEEVAVIGGGNTAVEEACYLTRFASRVYIIHRRDQFRADRLVCERAACNGKVVPVWDSVVEAIEGEDLVERVKVRNVKTGEVSSLEVAGVFMFVGTYPHVEFLEHLKEESDSGWIEQREGGWIVTGPHMNTSLPGVFAAGDVRETPLRQVVTAAADGAIAAMSAYHYIESGGQALELARK